MSKSEQWLSLTGTDAFGRGFGPAGQGRPGRKTGMFFWLWIGRPSADGVYDATEILGRENGFDTLFFQDAPESPDGQQHFWGKPVWGYYDSADEWVVRRQIELLMLAGVDFIVFDTTNTVTYPEVYAVVLRVIGEYAARGWNPPRAAFYTHSRSIQTMLKLYDELYKPGLFSDAWYREGGKPMMIAYTDPLDDLAEAATRGDTGYAPPDIPREVRDFFTLRKPQWPFDPVMEEGFPWIEWSYPQPLHKDVMSVSVASHPHVPFSFTLTRGWENWGRGWDPDARENRAEDVDTGGFFEKQWENAIAADPPMVFVGGWNEWIAYKQLWDGEYMLCDAVNREFSRDIEPMEGGFSDAFYLQLIRNNRRYKTEPGVPERHVFDGTALPPVARDSRGVSEGIRYACPAPENWIERVELHDDGESLSVTVVCARPWAREHDLTLFFEAGGRPAEGGGFSWKASYPGVVCRVESGGMESAAVRGSWTAAGAEVRVVFPLEAIGVVPGGCLCFKAAICVPPQEDVTAYDTAGSVLPPGRLAYAYRTEHAPSRTEQEAGGR